MIFRIEIISVPLKSGPVKYQSNPSERGDNRVL